MKSFSTRVLHWFDKHGRKNLPWQSPRQAYRVWLSEVMLQQTQVKTVLPYFNRFMERFPDVTALAAATEDEVFSFWSGLGYYRRARHLHQAAQLVSYEWGGHFPETLEMLQKLPGVGPSTAAAIASLAFNQPTAILDGNVKRVLSRHFLVAGPPEQAATQRELWRLANECMPKERCGDYTQAMMDLGALCCTSLHPTCDSCPLQTTCLANIQQCTEKYPHKKTKKMVPKRQQQFLMICNGDKVYLEKQPPTGLWGGLWCPLMIDKDLCPSTYLVTHYDMSIVDIKKLLEFKHTFSHFQLQITALAVKAKSNGTRIAENRGHWFTRNELQHLGLARPVTMIIDALEF